MGRDVDVVKAEDNNRHVMLWIVWTDSECPSRVLAQRLDLAASVK
jgi:hypothetical protein